MLNTLFSRIGWFVLLLLLQVLVFNHIHIAGYATPMPYVFLLLILPSDTPHWIYVAVGFLMGLLIDLFTNTPGMAAAALCLTGLFTPWLLSIFLPSDHENDEQLLPSTRSMEWGPFLRFATLTIFINTVAFFTLEAFAFAYWQNLLISIGGTTALTLLFVIAMELIRNSGKPSTGNGKR